MARGRRKSKRGGLPPLEPKRSGTVPSLPSGAKEEAGAEGADGLDRRVEALRERGETAIKSFLTFLFGAPLLLIFAELLRSAADAWPHSFAGLADPMEKVLSLADPKPVFAMQALALLVRASALLANRWKGNEQLFDALDALYAVTFSLIGFLAGGGLFLAVFRLSPTLLIVSIALGVLSFVVLVGIDVAELKMTRFLEKLFWRVALALVYLVFAAVALLTNK
jgi:hypothetical protein